MAFKHLWLGICTVNTVELKRLKDTFSKYATPNGLLQQSIFLSEILGDTVPNNLAEVCGAKMTSETLCKIKYF
jgi:hypothetical protein